MLKIDTSPNGVYIVYPYDLRYNKAGLFFLAVYKLI